MGGSRAHCSSSWMTEALYSRSQMTKETTGEHWGMGFLLGGEDVDEQFFPYSDKNNTNKRITNE